jgi:valyl-tRNA synthetase
MLSQRFDPAAAEPRLYDGWERGGAFAAHPDGGAEPFTIMVPPPNVTGSLHVGHALTFTLQDVLIRFRRMQGRDALWQPGTDHAGIATQMVVEKLLHDERQPGRKAMGRDAFVERVWRWKAESGGSITGQLRRLGASLDWPRERFTMDDGLSAAVRRVFVRLHGEGLIYRDRRLVNWDPQLQTAISDLEVETREQKGQIWRLRYPIDGEAGRFIVVATTRPETMLGDTAVAVHPDDARYADLVGRFVRLPLTGRRIPIVADAYSDPEKGTGAVKITPAHDFNDFEVGRRHALPMPSVLDREARVTLDDIEAELPPDAAFVRGLAGQGRYAARAAIVAELERLELLDGVEPHQSAVPHGDRSGVAIEPLLTTQWFCNAAALAGPAIAAVEDGRTAFVPKQWENTFFAWMRDIQPWCISRQLWWGHRIPAWHGPDGAVFVAEDAEAAAAQAREKYGRDEPLAQDEDVLDTWFSSALWPFSTLGWPEATADLARYYPGDVLVTGFDIIFFWVARMMMMGLHVMGDVPFRAVVINGLVRDERGQKMSKSKGNVIDPLQLIDEYGADALRFTACAAAGGGRDIKLGPAKVEASRAFVTKLWNAARFLEMNGAQPVAGFDPGSAHAVLNRWVLDAADEAVREATAALEAFRFGDYAAACYRFTWNVFCDWFLELAKPVFNGADEAAAAELRATSAHVFGVILRLLHPVIPFVTEELWDGLGYGPACSLIRDPWPVPGPAAEGAAEARAEIGWLVRLVTDIRAVRAEMNVAPSVLTEILLRGAAPLTLDRARRWIEPIRRMARASGVRELDGEMPHGSAQIVVDEATVILPLAGVIDLSAERARLARERAKAAAEAEKVVRKLESADFVGRAPAEIVEENRERLRTFRAEMERIDAALRRIA